LPWRTVSDALKAEFDRVKALRQRVRLKDAPRLRKRLWAKQLEVYDACSSQWVKNKDKYCVLLRVYRDRLGFRETLALLNIPLSPEGKQLATRLDENAVEIKGVFRNADRLRRHLEVVGYAEAADRGLSAETTNKVCKEIFFDEESKCTPVIDFDYEKVFADLDEAEPEVAGPQTLSSEDLSLLRSWRSYFCFPKPQLPPHIGRLKGATRRRWLAEAMNRIDRSCRFDSLT
jgi:hypothetical protein